MSELQEQVTAVLDHERQLQAEQASSESAGCPPQNGSAAGLPPEFQALQFLKTIALGWVLLSFHFRLHRDVFEHSIQLRYLQRTLRKLLRAQAIIRIHSALITITLS